MIGVCCVVMRLVQIVLPFFRCCVEASKSSSRRMTFFTCVMHCLSVSKTKRRERSSKK